MNSNNTEVNQLALQKIQGPSLRIAYKNEEEVVESRNAKPARKSKNVKPATEPIPLFNDYRFKAKDHDPL